MSEVLKYNRVNLGHAEKYILNEITAEPKSAYRIWDIRRKRGRPMNYKNVHTRIKKLEKLSLIEKVPGYFSRGAINYQLTTQGLFYQVSKPPDHELELVSLDELLHNYGDNIIIKTLLYPYFEVKTIKRATAGMYFAILDYLDECYRLTLNACVRIRKAIKENNKRHREKYTKMLKEDLQWLPRAFAFELVTKRLNGIIIGQLAKDKKFILLIKQVQRDFDKECDAINKIHALI
jgi:hypothetical protein